MSSPKKRSLGRGLDALIQRPEARQEPAAGAPALGDGTAAAHGAPAASGAGASGATATAAGPSGAGAAASSGTVAPPSNLTPDGVAKLPIDVLKPNQWQPRSHFDDEHLDSLTESIRAQGLVQPLVVSLEADGTYSIVAGERRWRAARRAGLLEVPVVVRGPLDDRTKLELALVENLQRSDLNPVEEAEAYLSLQEKFHLSLEEIAVRVGKGRPTVSNALRLLKLPPEVLDLLRHSRLTAGQARPLLALPTPERQVELAERAVRERLSARQLERMAAAPQPAAPPPPRQTEVHTVAAEEKLTRRLQTKVEIRRKGKGGRLQIHFHSEEELMRLYDALMEREEHE